MSISRLAALLFGSVLILVGCSTHDGHRRADLVVGSSLDGDAKLLAALYVSALRSYGFPAHAEAVADPMAKLDSGAVTVVPGYTGRVLQSLQPGASALSDKQVYQAMNAALPEGVAAGDYATAAEDKPDADVTPATSAGWGGSDLSSAAQAL